MGQAEPCGTGSSGTSWPSPPPTRSRSGRSGGSWPQSWREGSCLAACGTTSSWIHRDPRSVRISRPAFSAGSGVCRAARGAGGWLRLRRHGGARGPCPTEHGAARTLLPAGVGLTQCPPCAFRFLPPLTCACTSMIACSQAEIGIVFKCLDRCLL